MFSGKITRGVEMTKFFIPKKGDTVRVRLASGEVVDAEYLSLGHGKCHRVKAGGRIRYCLGKALYDFSCIFVGPGAVMEERK
jgi:hypothetical protein